VTDGIGGWVSELMVGGWLTTVGLVTWNHVGTWGGVSLGVSGGLVGGWASRTGDCPGGGVMSESRLCQLYCHPRAPPTHAPRAAEQRCTPCCSRSICCVLCRRLTQDKLQSKGP
jgi:hypothetical protein